MFAKFLSKMAFRSTSSAELAKETLKAVRDQDFKLAHKLEVKKLEILLQQVSQSNNDESDDEKQA